MKRPKIRVQDRGVVAFPDIGAFYTDSFKRSHCVAARKGTRAFTNDARLSRRCVQCALYSFSDKRIKNEGKKFRVK